MNDASPASTRAAVVIDRHRGPVEAALGRFVAGPLAAVPSGIAEPIRYAVQAGGKRFRPILVAASFQAVRGEAPPDAGYDAAAALELIHTYSLVHDDLPCMDDDALRRGRPTTHRQWGIEPATIAGAAMIPLACALLDRGAACCGLDRTGRAAIVRELTDGAGAAGMVGGQALDLEEEGRTPDAGRLRSIHTAKTGALFVAAMRIGGRLAGASADALVALGDCGRGLGLAFQVTDDILDVTGSDAVLGKSAGRDREQAKATYPALMGLDAAREYAVMAATDAVNALHRAAIHDDALECLVTFAVSRDR
jgi:geranylgeranyl diphosphate synthase, type II